MAQGYSDWPNGTTLPAVGPRIDPVEDALPGQGQFYVGRLGKFVATKREDIEVDGEKLPRLWYEAA